MTCIMYWVFFKDELIPPILVSFSFFSVTSTLPLITFNLFLALSHHSNLIPPLTPSLLFRYHGSIDRPKEPRCRTGFSRLALIVTSRKWAKGSAINRQIYSTPLLRARQEIKARECNFKARVSVLLWWHGHGSMCVCQRVRVYVNVWVCVSVCTPPTPIPPPPSLSCSPGPVSLHQQQQQHSVSQPLQRESMLGNSSLEFPWTRSRPPFPSLPLSHSPSLLLPSHPLASPSPFWLFHLEVIWVCAWVCVCMWTCLAIPNSPYSITTGLFVMYTAGCLLLTFSISWTPPFL